MARVCRHYEHQDFSGLLAELQGASPEAEKPQPAPLKKKPVEKPEKDPKAIAAAKNAPQSGYPKCMLCRESEGYAGRVDFPARQNHRIIPITIDNSPWFMQYSPYVYYNEHCIVFNSKHTPMTIDKSAFAKLLEFTTHFPHYFIGSNAELPIVGGSILSHEHFQGGRFEFAMERAPIETKVIFNGFEDIEAGLVKWPMSTIRLLSDKPERLVYLADKILTKWRGYSDESAFIFAETEGTPHNTITPIARRRGKWYNGIIFFERGKQQGGQKDGCRLYDYKDAERELAFRQGISLLYNRGR